ncbi:short-chain dehydrogenase reductase sdr [Colletotrichum scovillei]|uniref:short-chain dehydrogenase reductase sdr n=1 Tax=Colletotrichum scovillei TaxID=1209932 RepID=UPI0015C38737|nr:short-chain dehydrogenase reductase sdr [Colletotrichum scovillei]XP_035338402.1 short-chain dehydrogenase reductase sdr [Colletotrichum scovillei]KAF4772996.1 short-chain dehydrogenase reductase sdr [Colletotrichum scovillei]KAF4785399.1 short-chain dehydrogenase reductase sdr [Colletotrichum scovillei]
MPSSNSLRFDDRVVIITGSGRGLGRQHALLLGSLGASVVVNSTTSTTAQATVDDIIKAGGKATAWVGSVSDDSVAQALVKTAIDTFGRIDIIINNAGTFDPTPFEQITGALFREMLSVHVEGSYNLTHAAWPHMQKQNYGRVVMITSHTIFGMAGSAAYAAAKLALVGMAKTLAIEGEPHGILVNSVATTGFTDTVQKNTPDAGMQSFMEANLPAEDPARAVAWLVHQDCKVNGEVIGAQGRVVSRIFLGETEGFQGSRDGEWNAESIRDNWAQIVSDKDYVVPTDTNHLGGLLFQRLSGASAK